MKNYIIFNKILYSLIPLIIFTFVFLPVAFPIFAVNPSSDNYVLDSYTFGSGGTDSTSNLYNSLSISGETDTGNISSDIFNLNNGLTASLQANTPLPPTLVNIANNYDRLKATINPGTDTTDTLYAIAITDDNWVTTRYVQSDYTVGTTLGTEDWLPFQGVTSWNGSTGRFIRGLKAATTYKIKVTAKKGGNTQSKYSQEAYDTTSIPSLTFGLNTSNLSFSNLNSSNSFTDSSKSTVLTTSTNAYNGYIIYGRSLGPLSFLANSINDFGSANSTPALWAGIGFGYTTNDNNLSGGINNRFTSGGPKYAGFTTSAPGDPVADHTEIVEDTTINNEQFIVSYRVTASDTTPAGNYKTNIMYIVVPTF